MLLSPLETIATTHTSVSISIQHTVPAPIDPASSSESDGNALDEEEPDEESMSSPDSRHQEEVESGSSSAEEDGLGSEDADYEIEEDLHEAANGYSSSSKSGRMSRRTSKEKGMSEIYDNPDLYGLRRSVRFPPTGLT
jgi:hypothetical protein